MQFEISEIKALRRKIGMSQQELAKKSGVSQSLIAKIESGRLDPSFSNAKKVFDALSYSDNKSSAKVSEIMNRKVIFVSLNDTLKKAIDKMKKYEISQIPVISNDKVQGIVSEATIMNNIDKNISELKIRDVMSDPPPVISKNSRIETISSLLMHFPMVMVSDKGKIEGVITKADIIRNLGKGL